MEWLLVGIAMLLVGVSAARLDALAAGAAAFLVAGTQGGARFLG
jgi:hypothetical protein